MKWIICLEAGWDYLLKHIQLVHLEEEWLLLDASANASEATGKTNAAVATDLSSKWGCTQTAEAAVLGSTNSTSSTEATERWGAKGLATEAAKLAATDTTEATILGAETTELTVAAELAAADATEGLSELAEAAKTASKGCSVLAGAKAAAKSCAELATTETSTESCAELTATKAATEGLTELCATEAATKGLTKLSATEGLTVLATESLLSVSEAHLRYVMIWRVCCWLVFIVCLLFFLVGPGFI